MTRSGDLLLRKEPDGSPSRKIYLPAALPLPPLHFIDSLTAPVQVYARTGGGFHCTALSVRGGCIRLFEG